MVFAGDGTIIVEPEDVWDYFKTKGSETIAMNEYTGVEIVVEDYGGDARPCIDVYIGCDLIFSKTVTSKKECCELCKELYDTFLEEPEVDHDEYDEDMRYDEYDEAIYDLLEVFAPRHADEDELRNDLQKCIRKFLTEREIKIRI